jgi:hypothetical protein
MVMLAIAACGSEGGGADDAGTSSRADARVGMAATHWKEDGVLHNAIVAIGTRSTTGGIEFLQVVASDAGAGISFAVSSLPQGSFPAAAIGGGYACGSAGNVQVIFSSNVEDTNAEQTCHLTVTSPGVPGGAHATGSFTATITLVGGAKKQITEGVFDVAVQSAKR